MLLTLMLLRYLRGVFLRHLKTTTAANDKESPPTNGDGVAMEAVQEQEMTTTTAWIGGGAGCCCVNNDENSNRDACRTWTIRTNSTGRRQSNLWRRPRRLLLVIAGFYVWIVVLIFRCNDVASFTNQAYKLSLLAGHFTMTTVIDESLVDFASLFHSPKPEHSKSSSIVPVNRSSSSSVYSTTVESVIPSGTMQTVLSSWNGTTTVKSQTEPNDPPMGQTGSSSVVYPRLRSG